MSRRVVVTGVGIVSALGLSAEEHFEALASGACGAGEITAFEVGDFPVRFAAEVRGFKANKFIRKRKSIKIMVKDIQFAVAAANLAGRDGGIYDGVADPTRLGVSMGAGLIPTDLDDLGAAVAVSLDEGGRFDLRKYGKEGLANLFPLWLLKNLPNMLNSHTAIEFDARGPNNCLTVGNASGLLAIGEAARVIERGDAEMMLAGGAEAKVHPLSIARLYLQEKLSTAGDVDKRGPRPFCEDRGGMVVGEGGAVVLLEEASHAKARGGKAYAEVCGFGASCGGQLMEELEEGGGALAAAMEGALGDAGAEAGEVSAVFAGASGLAEDEAEAEAIARVLGAGKKVVATRAAAGHTMAAGGAMDFATACMAVSRGVLPGTYGVEKAGELAVELTGEASEGELGTVVVNTYSFGGQTASMVIRRHCGE